MLTPAKEDPNRDAELKRARAEPTSFGTSDIDIPKDWRPSGLAPVGGNKEAPKTKQPKS